MESNQLKCSEYEDMYEDNQHFNICGCGQTHTCGVVLHHFPLQFSAILM